VLLHLLEAHLVDVAKGDTHTVRRQRATLPEVVDEMLALVVLSQPQHRVALELRDDRLDVREEIPVFLRQFGQELLALLARERLVRDELGRRRLRLRPRGREQVRNRQRAALREPAVVVALAPSDVLDRGDNLKSVRARPLIGFHRRESPLRRRRQQHRLAFEHGPIAV